jgi:hypothetical protein
VALLKIVWRNSKKSEHVKHKFQFERNREFRHKEQFFHIRFFCLPQKFCPVDEKKTAIGFYIGQTFQM